MNRIINRLRAVLEAPVMLILMIVFACVLLMGQGKQKDAGLERRVETMLSQIEGVEKVDLIIRTRRVDQGTSQGFVGQGMTTEEIPCGALVSVSGVRDPIVMMQVTQAVCAILGLDASNVEVIGLP